MFEKNEYDRSVNTFSNQGRLYQVEYAMKAVEQGCTTLGIQTKDGIILGAEKKISSKLQIPSSIENIMKINENTICTYSGLRSDARALIETARVEAASHWFNFNEPMPVEAISLAVCDVALSFAEKKKKQRQKNEKRVVSRPYGVAMLIAGIDTDGEPKLFKNDPSGNYVRYKACCIGQGGENGMSTLQSSYKEDMNFSNSSGVKLTIFPSPFLIYQISQLSLLIFCSKFSFKTFPANNIASSKLISSL